MTSCSEAPIINGLIGAVATPEGRPVIATSTDPENPFSRVIVTLIDPEESGANVTDEGVTVIRKSGGGGGGAGVGLEAPPPPQATWTSMRHRSEQPHKRAGELTRSLGFDLVSDISLP